MHHQEAIFQDRLQRITAKDRIKRLNGRIFGNLLREGCENGKFLETRFQCFRKVYAAVF